MGGRLGSGTRSQATTAHSNSFDPTTDRPWSWHLEALRPLPRKCRPAITGRAGSTIAEGFLIAIGTCADSDVQEQSHAWATELTLEAYRA